MLAQFFSLFSIIFFSLEVAQKLQSYIRYKNLQDKGIKLMSSLQTLRCQTERKTWRQFQTSSKNLVMNEAKIPERSWQFKSQNSRQVNIFEMVFDAALSFLLIVLARQRPTYYDDTLISISQSNHTYIRAFKVFLKFRYYVCNYALLHHCRKLKLQSWCNRKLNKTLLVQHLEICLLAPTTFAYLISKLGVLNLSPVLAK